MKNFLKQAFVATAVVATLASCANAQQGNGTQSQTKRELLSQFLNPNAKHDYVPAAFFLHFPDKLGEKAALEHIEYFRATNMDFVKIQYEQVVPKVVTKAADFANVPVYDEDYWAPQVAVIKQIADSLKEGAFILPTVYSPLSLVRQSVDFSIRGEEFKKLLTENPELTEKAFANIEKSIENYISAARKAGADGFYVSSQGGDTKSLAGTTLWNDFVRKYDKKVSEYAYSVSDLTILHVCDYGSSYKELDSYADYPSTIINPPIHLEEGEVDLKHIAEVFKRPVFGGLDRLGVVAKGSIEEAKAAVDKVLSNAPDNFILGADCTVPGDTEYSRLRTIIDYAHTWRQTHKK